MLKYFEHAHKQDSPNHQRNAHQHRNEQKDNNKNRRRKQQTPNHHHPVQAIDCKSIKQKGDSRKMDEKKIKIAPCTQT